MADRVLRESRFTCTSCMLRATSLPWAVEPHSGPKPPPVGASYFRGSHALREARGYRNRRNFLVLFENAPSPPTTLCKVWRLTPSRCPRRASIAVAHTWQLGLGTSRTAPPHCRYSTISVRDDQASTAQGNRGRVSRPNNTADHSRGSLDEDGAIHYLILCRSTHARCFRSRHILGAQASERKGFSLSIDVSLKLTILNFATMT